jgi:hypothetical protein
MLRSGICIVSAITVLCAPATAQSSRAVDSLSAGRAGASSSEVWAGYSPGSTSAGVLGRHGGITLGLLGLRLNHRVRALGSRVVYYTLDIIPVARVTPIIQYTRDADNRCEPPKFDCIRSSAVARGIGVSPLGLTLLYRTDRRVQVRFGANGGLLLFDRAAPSDLSSQFNFTAAIEGGLQFVNENGTGVLLVYRLHHLSNAGLGEDNLAILSHIISIGARWRLGR